jgi:hypothetical protein
MLRSNLKVRFVDSDNDRYLMSGESLEKAIGERTAAILCEVYGLRYSASVVDGDSSGRQNARIWDMAMCIPRAEDFLRLAPRDVAVVSFGLGKCLYAGWGGLLVTRNSALAARVRGLRDELASNVTIATRFRHGVEVIARTAAHNRLLYGLCRAVADRRYRASAPPAEATPPTPFCPIQAELSRDWTEPMTPLNRRVAFANVRDAAKSEVLARRKSEVYLDCLEAAGVTQGIDRRSLPQSHFPIRVAARIRNKLRQYLARRGIDTATYFPFPKELQRSEFPLAAQAADEVVLLPLGPCIREGEVTTVARHVGEGLKELAP